MPTVWGRYTASNVTSDVVFDLFMSVLSQRRQGGNKTWIEVRGEVGWSPYEEWNNYDLKVKGQTN